MPRLKETRAEMNWGSGPFNQEQAKKLAEIYRRLDGDTQSKGYKAEQRKAQDEKFTRNWIKEQSELNLAPKQRFKLALKRENDQDIQLLFNNDDDFEAFGYRVNRFTFPAIEPISMVENI